MYNGTGCLEAEKTGYGHAIYYRGTSNLAGLYRKYYPRFVGTLELADGRLFTARTLAEAKKLIIQHQHSLI